MKVKHTIIIFVIGLCFDLGGGLFKILYYQYADKLLILGMILKVAGLLLFLTKLIKHPKIKEFLNS